MEKPWYTSKLVWMNVLLSAIGILDLVASWIEAGNVTPEGVVMLTGGALGVILRIWFTDTKLTA